MPGKLALLILLAAGLWSCSQPLTDAQERGAQAVARHGCGGCHTIRGVDGAHGLVGPPLTGIGGRTYVAGMLPNTQPNLAAWVFDPKAINPKTVMPKVGLSEHEAQDIAEFLRTR